jgi:hypothetical protein
MREPLSGLYAGTLALHTASEDARDCHGKEGVAGSSPAEGFKEPAGNGGFFVPEPATRPCHFASRVFSASNTRTRAATIASLADTRGADSKRARTPAECFDRTATECPLGDR